MTNNLSETNDIVLQTVSKPQSGTFNNLTLMLKQVASLKILMTAQNCCNLRELFTLYKSQQVENLYEHSRDSRHLPTTGLTHTIVRVAAFSLQLSSIPYSTMKYIRLATQEPGAVSGGD